jgi:methylenetetrahydrofolate dehydrogenase (NADP+)/methenyltetrahydrofolate cyclohydrolase
MALDMSTFIPATPYGILELLDRYGVETKGKHTVVMVVICGKTNEYIDGKKGFRKLNSYFDTQLH